jgi:pimeloyl-ACP methyl ester carboxylesterase
MKTIYYISGLGADERVFKYLNLQGVNEKYIKWETPQQHEKLQDYCKRLIRQIDEIKDIILVGVSFGGIVAQEISKMIKVDKVIILSSIKSVEEMDWQLHLVRILGLYKLAPSRFLKLCNLLTGNYYFSTKTKAESDLLRLIIKDTDRFFMKWAIAEIMKWDNRAMVQNLTHIHGEEDRIFPIKNIQNATGIRGGGHFMIVNKANEITEIIQKEIN